MVTKDIYQGIIKPGADDKQVMKMSRITTAISGVLCSVAATVLCDFSSVYSTFLQKLYKQQIKNRRQSEKRQMPVLSAIGTV